MPAHRSPPHIKVHFWCKAIRGRRKETVRDSASHSSCAVAHTHTWHAGRTRVCIDFYVGVCLCVAHIAHSHPHVGHKRTHTWDTHIVWGVKRFSKLSLSASTAYIRVSNATSTQHLTVWWITRRVCVCVCVCETNLDLMSRKLDVFSPISMRFQLSFIVAFATRTYAHA